MINNPNQTIETELANFTVNGNLIPVAFLRYRGDSDTYITYQQTDSAEPMVADDDLQYYIDFYDFDIFTKGNYIRIAEVLINKLETIGFRWKPTRSSGDLFEEETGLYHKTLSFATERKKING